MLLHNKHIQTLYRTFSPPKFTIPYEIERFELSDGDFIECHWHTPNKNTPLIALFHGLTGSYKSPYITSHVKWLTDNGYNTVVVHFRGCSGVPNRLERSYHSGETRDAYEFLSDVRKRFENTPLYGLGFSVGANVLLKLTQQHPTLFTKTVAISAPMKLDVCARHMDKPRFNLYRHILLKELKEALLYKYEHFDMQSLLGVGKKEIAKINSFVEFDEIYTAPIHGFASAQEYYTLSSSFYSLKNILTPTLIIHAKDDPFMTPEVIPGDEDISGCITLEVKNHGGHMGFIQGSFLQPDFWLERRVLEYFNTPLK